MLVAGLEFEGPLPAAAGRSGASSSGAFGVLAMVVTASVDAPVAGFGVKLPAAPAGNPLTLNVTAAVKPLVGLTVTL